MILFFYLYDIYYICFMFKRCCKNCDHFYELEYRSYGCTKHVSALVRFPCTQVCDVPDFTEIEKQERINKINIITDES